VRVALIGPVPPRLGGATPGGVATHQVHLAAGLAAAGIYAPLLATSSRVPASKACAADGQNAFPLYRMAAAAQGRRDFLAAVGPVPLVRYAVRLSRAHMNGSRREMLEDLLWYRRFTAEVQPTVLHVQHPLERCLYARTVLHFERWRLPLVVTAHSLFGEHSDEAIRTLMAPNLRAADHVIAVSDHIAHQAISLGVAPDRISVIRSGVDLDHFRPRDRAPARAALGISEHTPLVLFVGNLEPRKQVDVLLRALARVRDSVPGLVALVVGSGESAGVQDQSVRLVRLSQELGLDGVVRFVGSVADEHLLDMYAAADVFALPSSSEAQGIVALEAMASGLPVVASAVGGLLGTIDDGQTGCLVPPGDVTSLAERILELLQDRPRRATMAAAARQKVERDFSWQHAVAATIEVYRHVLANPRPAPGVSQAAFPWGRGAL
jgi:glycosyltransferase involved in cell wall biosynthesis